MYVCVCFQAEIALGLPHIKACPSGRRNDYDPMLSMEKMEEMERAQTRQAA